MTHQTTIRLHGNNGTIENVNRLSAGPAIVPLMQGQIDLVYTNSLDLHRYFYPWIIQTGNEIAVLLNCRNVVRLSITSPVNFILDGTRLISGSTWPLMPWIADAKQPEATIVGSQSQVLTGLRQIVDW